MKHYLSLIGRRAQMNRRQSRMTRLCIALAVFLAAGLFSMADMEMRSQMIQTIRTDGAWHVCFRTGNDEEKIKRIGAWPQIQTVARYAVTNYRLDKEYRVGGRLAAICGFDKALVELYPEITIEQGRFPQGMEEAMVTQNVCDRQGLAIGDRVTLSTPDGGALVYTITGVCSDIAAGLEYDAYLLFLNAQAYAANFAKDTLEDDFVLYAQYKPGVRVADATREICEQLGMQYDTVGQNAKLLALMFQSEDSYIGTIYGVAAALSVLVILAGVLMIAGSLNSEVGRRTAFFGMMRCLGATPRQVSRFVLLEALMWCVMAIPAGLAASTATVWALCALLRALSPAFFADLPVFGVSVMGLACGGLIGLITVLFAARSPAKRASRVSPLTAVSGNAGTTHEAAKAAGHGMLPVEAALGVHHACGSRKNLALMAGSFALSITLFLCFSAVLSFMQHAMPAMSPSAPDISIISEDNACALPKSLAEDIEALGASRRVYGRGFAFSLPFETEHMKGEATLISYEEHQFAWARQVLVQGDVDKAMQGEGVLAVVGNMTGFAQGDTLTLQGTAGDIQVTVCGTLSDSPFDSEFPILICSESLFERLTRETGYTVIDVQLAAGATNAGVEAIRSLAPEDSSFSDRRLKNRDARGAYYAFAVFCYGFLTIIALISMCNIINSMSMSVTARMRQFGAMRAIGMGMRQMKVMVFAEAGSYAACGTVLGVLLGLPLHWLFFESLITSRWGDVWTVPMRPLLLILLLLLAAVLLSVAEPIRRICTLSIVDTIGEQ